MAYRTPKYQRVSLYDQPMSVHFVLFHQIFKAQNSNIPVYENAFFAPLIKIK